MFNKIILILILSFVHFYAQANEVYVIKNIKISATNKIASVARNEAIENGQLKAFRGLVKLHYPDALNQISSIEKEDIFSLVEGYELSEERRSATHYFAKLKVKFSRPHVDKLMSSLGANFSQGAVHANNNPAVTHDNYQSFPQAVSAPTMTTLVVPVLTNGHQEYWFDDENIWLNLWKLNLAKDQSKKFILPIADLEDLILLNKELTNKNLIDLTPLFEKYNVNNIAIYTLEDIVEGHNHLVSLKVNYINKYHYSWQKHNFTASSGNDLAILLPQAYSQAQQFNFIEDNKATRGFTEIEAQKITTDFPVKKVSDWVYLQKILAGINYISNVTLNKVALKNYNFSFTSTISIDDLKELFKQHGFILEESDNKFTLLKDEYNHEEY